MQIDGGWIKAQRFRADASACSSVPVTHAIATTLLAVIRSTVAGSKVAPSRIRCPCGSFGREFEQHFNRGCQSCRDTIVAKIVDFDPSKASFTYFRDRRVGGGS
jgi:hypothetical protein